MKPLLPDEEHNRRLAELVAWIKTDEAREEIRQAVECAREDAEMFMRMDIIEPEILYEPTTL